MLVNGYPRSCATVNLGFRLFEATRGVTHTVTPTVEYERLSFFIIYIRCLTSKVASVYSPSTLVPLFCTM